MAVMAVKAVSEAVKKEVAVMTVEKVLDVMPVMDVMTLTAAKKDMLVTRG